jgi:hypothetical protein
MLVPLPGGRKRIADHDAGMIARVMSQRPIATGKACGRLSHRENGLVLRPSTDRRRQLRGFKFSGVPFTL